MIYLPDEMFKSKHKTYSIHFGKPIPWQTFDSSRKPAEWAEWVKEIVYNLKEIIDFIICKTSSNRLTVLS